MAMRMQVRKANGCLGSRKPRCGVVELDRWRWFGWLEKDAGSEISHFFAFRNPHAAKLKLQALIVVPLLGSRASSTWELLACPSPSHVSFIPDSLSRRTSCGLSPCAFIWASGLGFGGAARFVCARSYR